MKFCWPPDETKNWILESVKLTQSKYFFSTFPKSSHILLLGYRIVENTTPNLRLVTLNKQEFILPNESNTWHMFPWPLEIHAIGTVWSHLESVNENHTIELAYYPIALRQFYMRALLNEEGEMVFAYRYNKNGKLIWFSPYKTEIMSLPEETLTFPPTTQVNAKGIHLLASKSLLKTKKEILSNGTE